jgi:hypothetical protein
MTEGFEFRNKAAVGGCLHLLDVDALERTGLVHLLEIEFPADMVVESNAPSGTWC